MTTKSEVTIARDDGLKDQFGHRDFYRMRVLGSRKMMIIMLVVFSLVVVPMIFMGSPEPATERKSTLGFNGDVRQSRPPDLDLPSHENVEADLKAKEEQLNKNRVSSRSAEKFTGPELLARPGSDKVPPGTMVKAVLISGASNGPVKAQLQESVSVNGETLIPSGAILVGKGTSNEDRLKVQFTKAVLRDGSVVVIQAQAADFQDKIAGLNGSKVGSYAFKLAAAVGLNFVTGMSQGLEDSQMVNGGVYKPPTLQNSLYNGTAMAASEQAQELLNSTKGKQVTIEVPAGTQIWVLFDDN